MTKQDKSNDWTEGLGYKAIALGNSIVSGNVRLRHIVSKRGLISCARTGNTPATAFNVGVLNLWTSLVEPNPIINDWSDGGTESLRAFISTHDLVDEPKKRNGLAIQIKMTKPLSYYEEKILENKLKFKKYINLVSVVDNGYLELRRISRSTSYICVPSQRLRAASLLGSEG